ncbi:MAG TPA: four-carbon acid sugar kinase family protein [Trueperaceae bacterium]|nr:four-carbon acid sugar kinase family protein [Trueperaceae bacterium]
MILGVVADDLTGATDVGSMSAKAGHLTYVYRHVYAHGSFHGGRHGAVCVLDTDSRLNDTETAYAKVFEATKALRAAGCERFHNKTCSVFRGNVGPEFDAMLDALGAEFAVVVLGFPKNGRTTVDGVHYVNGVRLEDSPFRHDPVHPMTQSRLVDILSAQTQRRVSSIGHEVVAGGEVALTAAIAAERERGGYLILDVVDQAALATIAAALVAADVRVSCGASAVVEELALAWPAPTDPGAATRLVAPLDGSSCGPSGVLVVAGSLTPQTAEQIEWARDAGIRTLTLDTTAVFSEAGAYQEVTRLARLAAEVVSRGDSVLVHADNRPQAVRSTQAAGAALGLDRAATGRLVSGALAQVADLCREHVGLTKLVVAGGDTSAAVCRRLGVHALRVLAEVAPGVPACEAFGGDAEDVGGSDAGRLIAVFKSGSFGGPKFLVTAVAHLQEVDACIK